MTAQRIACIPGDGIGVEVTDAARKILGRVSRRFDIELEWTDLEWSCEYYTRTERMMPPDGIELLRGHDAILLGAVGWPGVPDHVSLWGLLIPIRRAFRQYVNLRPVRLMPGVTGPLRDPGAVDMEIVRENNEGEYSAIGGRLYEGTPEELAVQQATFTRAGTERVMRYAFALARRRKGRVTSATKSNGIIHTMPFWDQVFAEQAAAHPDVRTDQYLIDAFAALLVSDPARFDVIVASNLFGDILSDLAAAVVGSIGIAPSANLNPERAFPSMFEPVHGSAPDIAGKGVANPIGQIWSAAMMLEHLGHADAAAAVMAAVEASLASADSRTRDLGGSADTATVVEALLERL